MKISNLETAMKLAKITGRPLEDFYDGEIEQKQEECLEVQEEESDSRSSDDTSQVQDDEIRPVRRVLCEVQNRTIDEKHGEAALYTVKYGGRLSENGVVIGHTKDMSNAEYKSLTKKMTQQDILKSPLLFVFFRAVDQAEGHFWSWLDRFPKE